MRHFLLLVASLASAACGSLSRSSEGRSPDSDDQQWIADTITDQLADRRDLLASGAWCLAPIVIRSDGEMLSSQPMRSAVAAAVLAAGADFYPETRAGESVIRISAVASPVTADGSRRQARYDIQVDLLAADGRLLDQITLRLDKHWSAQPKWK